MYGEIYFRHMLQYFVCLFTFCVVMLLMWCHVCCATIFDTSCRSTDEPRFHSCAGWLDGVCVCMYGPLTVCVSSLSVCNVLLCVSVSTSLLNIFSMPWIPNLNECFSGISCEKITLKTPSSLAFPLWYCLFKKLSPPLPHLSPNVCLFSHP